MTKRKEFFTTAPNRRPITRRQMLYAAGALGGGAMLLPSILPRNVRAQTNGIKRIVIMTSDHQIMPSVMHMRQGFPAGEAFEHSLASAATADFPAVLAELAGYKDRLTVLEGLGVPTALPNSEGWYVNHHDTSHSNLLTGAGIRQDQESAILGPSVDQIIAETVRHPDRISSLELGVGQLFQGGFASFGVEDKTPLENSPRSGFERLFANFIDETPAEPTEQALIAERQGQVLDFLDGRFAGVAGKLAGEDRQKLENHREMIADLERRMQGIRELECGAPEDSWIGGNGNKPETVRQFAKIVAAAFACDMTRVATIQVSQLRNEEFGAGPGDVHQDFAHQSRENDAAEMEMRKYNIEYAKLMRSIADEISAYSDSEGNLLDSTLIVWMSEHGVTRQAHTMYEHPAVMIGNLNGHFKTGRYISVPRDQPHPKTGEAPIGTAHSHFLVSLMQGMGLTDNFINLQSYERGDGSQVSLSGPLAQLT